MLDLLMLSQLVCAVTAAAAPPEAVDGILSKADGGTITVAEAGQRVYYGTLAELNDSLTEAKAAGNLPNHASSCPKLLSHRPHSVDNPLDTNGTRAQPPIRHRPQACHHSCAIPYIPSLLPLPSSIVIPLRE